MKKILPTVLAATIVLTGGVSFTDNKHIFPAMILSKAEQTVGYSDFSVKMYIESDGNKKYINEFDFDNNDTIETDIDISEYTDQPITGIFVELHNNSNLKTVSSINWTPIIKIYGLSRSTLQTARFCKNYYGYNDQFGNRVSKHSVSLFHKDDVNEAITPDGNVRINLTVRLGALDNYLFDCSQDLFTFESNYNYQDGKSVKMDTLKVSGYYGDYKTVNTPYGGVHGYLEEIVIPEMVDGKLVTEFKLAELNNITDLTSPWLEIGSITIPKSVETIDLDVVILGNERIIKPEVIYCYSDSAAQKYAIDNNIPYELLDENDDPTPGDLDGDGNLTYMDVSKLIDAVNMEVPVTDELMAAADLDHSGTIDYLDLSLLIDMINNT